MVDDASCILKDKAASLMESLCLHEEGRFRIKLRLSQSLLLKMGLAHVVAAVHKKKKRE